MKWNQRILIKDLPLRVEQEVELQGWVQFTRKSGKVRFIGFRDGSGTIQLVMEKGLTPAPLFELWPNLTQEAAIWVKGTVKASAQGQFEVELWVQDLKVLGSSVNFPITPKEHG